MTVNWEPENWRHNKGDLNYQLLISEFCIGHRAVDAINNDKMCEVLFELMHLLPVHYKLMFVAYILW